MNQTILAFGFPETVVKEYTYWVVMLRPQQVTLGTLIIAAKSDVTKLGDLDSDVWTEFKTVAFEMEDLLAKKLGAEKFNYLALMMKDPNPHFHLVPRYSKSVLFNGKEYVDPDWPHKTELKKIELTQEYFAGIMKELK